MNEIEWQPLLDDNAAGKDVGTASSSHTYILELFHVYLYAELMVTHSVIALNRLATSSVCFEFRLP